MCPPVVGSAACQQTGQRRYPPFIRAPPGPVPIPSWLRSHVSTWATPLPARPTVPGWRLALRSCRLLPGDVAAEGRSRFLLNTNPQRDETGHGLGRNAVLIAPCGLRIGRFTKIEDVVRLVVVLAWCDYTPLFGESQFGDDRGCY